MKSRKCLGLELKQIESGERPTKGGNKFTGWVEL